MVGIKHLFFSLAFLLSLTLLFGSFVGCTKDNPVDSENSDPAPGASGGDTDTEDQEPAYISSIRVSGNDNDDYAQLSKLAKITSDQAEKDALDEVPGKVIETELENENGNVVYAVEIDTGSGIKEVKVDAGNGSILLVEDDDDDDDDDDEPGGLESDHEFDGEEEGEH